MSRHIHHVAVRGPKGLEYVWFYGAPYHRAADLATAAKFTAGQARLIVEWFKERGVSAFLTDATGNIVPSGQRS